MFGNAALQVSFAGLHTVLTLQIESRVETLLVNPFDYLTLDPNVVALPAQYEQRVASALWPYLYRQELDPSVNAWASQAAAAVGYQTQPFLLKLTEQISSQHQSVTRHLGAPHTPAHTLATGSGACRDLAVLLMDACRSQGIASRFVSGYVYEPNRTDHNELHGWAEVYLPGGGWRGYDPSLGIAVADAHVPVAAAPEAAWTNPADGFYFGTGGDSTIEYEVRITGL